MTITKRRTVSSERYSPAHELAARATSKHGNPADHVVVAAYDVAGSAKQIAACLYASAIDLQERSRLGGVTITVAPSVREEAVAVESGVIGETLVERGGFTLAFGPSERRAACPRFEGQVRVDAVADGISRIVVVGRYSTQPAPAAAENDGSRLSAQSALEQIMRKLAAGLGVGMR